MIRITWKEQDITYFVTLVQVEQTLAAAGREAHIRAICIPESDSLSLLNPACGDAMTVTVESEVLFSGTVQRVEWDSQSGLLTMLCLEPSSLLVCNEVYRAFSGSAKEITTILCHLCNLPVGQLWDKPGQCFIPPSCGRSLHAILRQAYGQDCVVESRNGALIVRQTGVKTYTLHSNGMLSLSSSQSCEDVITAAEVISATGDAVATAARPDWEMLYGPRRRVYVQNGSRSQAEAQARDHLAGPAHSAQLVLQGDPTLACGHHVLTDAAPYGLRERYLIRRVLHQLENGIFTTTIGMVSL